jgi:hypothetical protein
VQAQNAEIRMQEMVDEQMAKVQPMLDWIDERQQHEKFEYHEFEGREILKSQGVGSYDVESAYARAGELLRADAEREIAAGRAPANDRENALKWLTAAAREVTSRGGSLIDVAHHYTTVERRRLSVIGRRRRV